MDMFSWRQEDISLYLEVCWSIPPLFLEQEAEKVSQILSWNSIKMEHDELIELLSRERRFPWYHEINKGISMIFQDYVELHQRRIHSGIFHHQDEYVASWIWEIDILIFWSLYHDTPEGISVVWDIPSPIKEWFWSKIREIHNSYESRLIQIVCLDILDPKITWHSEAEMLKMSQEIDRKNTLKWQLLSYEDKLDACMVCLHEVRSWNYTFFLNKLKWYKNFIDGIIIKKRLPLLHEFIPNISQKSRRLQELYNLQQLSDQLQQVIFCDDIKTRDSLIDTISCYQIWKEMTQNIDSVKVGNVIMSGYQVLHQQRSGI